MNRVDAIYARQSADRADSISIESQIEFCMFETHGDPCEIYADRGYSGKNTDRPEFLRMLDRIQEGRIKRVICYKLDRCSRSILDFTSLMEFFRTHGVEFMSCTEKFDTSGPMGRAMLNICIVFAQLERETIQQRVYDAYHARCRHGFYMGGRVPFGFRLQPCLLEDKRTSCYIPHEAESDVLLRLFSLYALPGYSLADVIASADAMGIQNPRREDGQWIRSHLARMLRNPIYVKADLSVYYYFKDQKIPIQNPPEDFIGIHGCYLYSDRQENTKLLVLAPHKGLVSSDLWLACRRKGRSERQFVPSGVKYTWLSGRIKCGLCGYAMVVRRVKGYNCFRCSVNLESTKRCESSDVVEVSYLQAAILPKIKQQLDQLATYFRTESVDTASIPKERIRIAALEAEAEALMEKLPHANEVVFTRIQQRLTELDQQMKSYLSVAEKNKKQTRSAYMPTQSGYSSVWEELQMDEKIQIVHLLIKRIEVCNNTIHVFWEI